MPGAGGALGPPTSTARPPGYFARRLPPAGQPRRARTSTSRRRNCETARLAQVRRTHRSGRSRSSTSRQRRRPRASPPGRRPRRGVPRRGHGPARPIAAAGGVELLEAAPAHGRRGALWRRNLRPEHLPHDHYLARDLVQDHPRKIFVRGQGSLCADRHGAPGARRPGRHAGDEQQLATPSPCAAWTVKDDAAPT